MRTIIGIFFFFVVVFGAISGTLFLIAISQWVFDREAYESIIEQPVIYERFLAELPDYAEEPDGFFVTTYGDQIVIYPALATAYQQVLTVEYLREQASRNVDELFTWFNTANYIALFEADFTPVKESISANSEVFSQTLAENLPICETGQEPRNPDEVLPRCRTNSTPVTDAQASIQASLPAYIDSLPNTLELGNTIDNESVEIVGSVSVRAAFYSTLVLVTLISLFLWLVNALIGGRGLRGRFIWLGITLLLPALLVLISGLSFQSNLNATTSRIISDITVQLSAQDSTVRETLQEVIQPFFSRIANSFVLVGGVAVAAGFVLFLLGLLAPPVELRPTEVIVPQSGGNVGVETDEKPKR